MLVAVVALVISGCSNTNSNTKSQEQNEERENFNVKKVTEVTEEENVSDVEEQSENPLELTAQNPDVKLNVGEQKKLFYIASQDVTVTYTSSDEAVATVDSNGIVTAVGGGTVTITASCESVSCEWTITTIPAEFAAYKKFIEEKGYISDDDFPTYNDIRFAVLDLNNDGTFDLIIESLDNNFGCVGRANVFYTYRDGQVKYCSYQCGFLEKYDPEQQICVWTLGADEERLFSINADKVNLDLSLDETGISYLWEDPNLEHVGEQFDAEIYKTYGKYWILFCNPDDENLNRLTSDYFISEQYQTDQINGIEEEY